METLQNILSQEIVQRLGWTLVHFVWQAAAIGLILAIVLKLLHKASSNLRYIIACVALALIVLIPAVTIKIVNVSVANVEPIKQATIDLPKTDTGTNVIVEMPQVKPPPAQVVASPKVPLKDRFADAIEPALPYTVVGWLIGVFGLSLWHLGGWTQLQRLRRQMVKQVTPTLKTKLQQLSDALCIHKTVGLVESALVQVPTVVGHLKPVILLPASALTGLSPEQIEAILAHELAHIKRCDYLVNMLQTVVEILGFYHPAVWWVSSKIRVERENCCDDLAVSLCSDRVCYAKALTTMEEIRGRQLGLAMAASGGSLFDRIRRLLGKDSANEEKPSWLPSVIAMLLIAGLLIPTALALSSDKNMQAVIKNDKVHVYQVNRNVSDFPFQKDLSTPENAYAYASKLLADGQSLREISEPELKEKMPIRTKKREGSGDKPRLNYQILEVRIFRDTHAYVIAKVPQLLKDDYNVRHFKKVEGQWLNIGEGGSLTLDGARKDFSLMCQLYDRKDNPLEYSDEIKPAAQQLFDGIKNADYEAFLNSQKKTWWNDFPTWNTYMALKWHDELVKWICNTFKENPIVKIELGKVFISDVKALDLKNLPAVPYKLTLKDGGIIEGVLPFRYFPERKGSEVKAYWQGLHGIDWHLQDEPIKKSTSRTALPTKDGHSKITDMIIVPGERVGEYTFDMSKDNVLEKLGKPKTIFYGEERYTLDNLPKTYYMVFDNVSFQIVADSVKEITVINPFYRFADGLGVGDSEEEVKQAFGSNYEVEETKWKDFMAYKDKGVVFEINKNDRTIMEINLLEIDNSSVPQILTTSYILTVPADLPQLKEIIPINKASFGTPTITPEKFEAFLNIVQNTPQARMIAAPKLLTNNGEEGEIRTDNIEDAQIILKIKNTVDSDKKNIRMQLDFNYLHNNSQGQKTSVISTKTMVMIPSGHAVVVSGMMPQEGQAAILLVKPEILEKPYSKTGVVETESQKGQAEDFKQRLEETVTVHIEHSPESDKLSVQYAAMAICKAAGVPYNWDKSAELTDTECRRYIDPVNIKDKVASQAIADMLGPLGLLYSIDGHGVYLYKPEKAGQVQSNLQILNLELEPVAQGKNILYANIKNTSNTEQLFAIHIYTRSVDYGPQGVGWGTPFFEKIMPNETKRVRFVYKIQGPVTKNTYIRVKFYNPTTEEQYDYKTPFAERTYTMNDLKVYKADEVQDQTASQEQFNAVSKVFVEIQRYIRNGEYEKAWQLFTEDYKKSEYQTQRFERFVKQMKPVHPLDSAFLWEKDDFLKLNPLRAFQQDDKIILQAGEDRLMWRIYFIRDENKWKIDDIVGYGPKILDIQKADNN